jgi:hypothetical protein
MTQQNCLTGERRRKGHTANYQLNTKKALPEPSRVFGMRKNLT